MAYLFRSEDMQYVSITMQRDKAEYVTRRIGELGLIHVVNLADEASLKSDYMRDYKKRIVVATQNEKRLDEFEKLMGEYNISLPIYDPQEVKIMRGCNAEFDTTWRPIEKELKINMESAKTLQKKISELQEERYVLVEYQNNINFEAEAQELKLNAAANNRADMKTRLLDPDNIELQGMQDDDQKFFKYICGVIPVPQQVFFTRMLYRLSRGNAFVRYLDIDEPIIDPESGQPVRKSVFYIVSIGRGLSNKLAKLCNYFQASIYRVPERNTDACNKRLEEIDQGIEERASVLRRSNIQIRKLLRQVAENKDTGRSMVSDWRLTLNKEKMLCETLMKTRRYLTMIRLDGWVPRESVNYIKEEVDHFENAGQSGSIAVDDNYNVDDPAFRKAHGDPPTHFKTNNFTGIYQGIVNTYGVPKYKEVNPGLFTCATFPFIFGVMYGDIGHGGALFVIACYFLIFEEKFLEQQRRGEMGELMKYAFGSRYALILMGFFAFYCGAIYNDFISVPLQIFESQWNWNVNLTETNNKAVLNENYEVYAFGVDYNWYHTKNELTFFNSLKMKMAVVLGVTQMLFGISLGAFNYVFFSDYTSLYYVWIPQMLFMICTFGYMCFMIIFKWTQDYRDDPDPPALIQTMIKMFLSPGAIDSPLYEGQAVVQVTLLLIAVATVPVMLLVKPILNNRERQAEHAPLIDDGHPAAGEDSSDVIGGGLHEDERKEHEHVEEDHEEHSFGAELIHSGIHTIEFVLGAVSNTASYLRLWALSLAHAQLAKVFFQKLIIEYGAETESDGMRIIAMVATYAAWFCATFAVLMCMDLLECFLHALRLHWVEFQNKFYVSL